MTKLQDNPFRPLSFEEELQPDYRILAGVYFAYAAIALPFTTILSSVTLAIALFFGPALIAVACWRHSLRAKRRRCLVAIFCVLGLWGLTALEYLQEGSLTAPQSWMQILLGSAVGIAVNCIVVTLPDNRGFLALSTRTVIVLWICLWIGPFLSQFRWVRTICQYLLFRCICGLDCCSFGPMRRVPRRLS